MSSISVALEEVDRLRAVAEAASDLKLAKWDKSFARVNGGINRLEQELFEKVGAWESWASENAPDTQP